MSEEDELYELFVRLFARHEPDLRRFIRSLLPTQTDADEVLQQTALVIWRKFSQFDPDTHFMKWACVIARFEALGYRRKMARDRLVFRDDIFDLIAEEEIEDTDRRLCERRALDQCLGELNQKHRELVTLAYTNGVKVVDLAKSAGASPEAFYMKLSRIRKGLLKCIESKLPRLEQNL